MVKSPAGRCLRQLVRIRGELQYNIYQLVQMSGMELMVDIYYSIICYKLFRLVVSA